MADKPVTREEKYLAYLTGDYTGKLPKPITRKEKYLYELCLKGMGGEVSPEEIKSAVNEYLEKNPVKPGATTEQAQQIEQNKTDIGSLKEDIVELNELKNELKGGTPVKIYETEIGGINNNTGASYANNKMLRSKNFEPYNGEHLQIVIEDGYECVFYWYDSSETYKTKAILNSSLSPFDINNVSFSFYKVTFKKTDGSYAVEDWKKHITIYDITHKKDGFVKETDLRLTEVETGIFEMTPLVNNLKDNTKVYTEGVESGYYRVYNGTVEAKSGTGWTRAKITVESYMASVFYTIKQKISDTAIYCAFTDSNDTLINNYNTVGINSVNIPKDAKYIYLSFFGDTYNSEYTIKATSYVTSTEFESLGLKNNYKGLTAVAFGTSLTYRAQTTGGYLQYLPEISGMTIDNQGVGSSKIYGNAETSILNKVLNYSNYEDKDVVIIEGFVNDWYNNSPLGDIYDTDESTVCGCLYKAIKHILTLKDSMSVVVVLDHFGINNGGVDMSPSLTKNVGKQFDYYEKLADVCALYGIPCIKEYKSGRFNQMTSRYYLDYIHLNPIGAKQSANVIWSELKNIDPSI